MDDPPHDALLEELRKLRSEVRGLHRTASCGLLIIGLITMAVALEVKWFKESLIAVVLTACFAGLIWICREMWLAKKAARKLKATARMVITGVPSSRKP